MLTRAVDVWISSSMRSLSVRGSKGEAVGGGEASRILMVKTEEEEGCDEGFSRGREGLYTRRGTTHRPSQGFAKVSDLPLCRALVRQHVRAV